MTLFICFFFFPWMAFESIEGIFPLMIQGRWPAWQSYPKVVYGNQKIVKPENNQRIVTFCLMRVRIDVTKLLRLIIDASFQIYHMENGK